MKIQMNLDDTFTLSAGADQNLVRGTDPHGAPEQLGKFTKAEKLFVGWGLQPQDLSEKKNQQEITVVMMW